MSKIPKNQQVETTIYTLSHPDTKEIRYIGKTVKALEDRLTSHIYDSVKRKDKKTITHKDNWLRKLNKEGKIPLIEKLDSTEWYKSQELEKYWIAIYKNLGFNLLNQTDGGEGNLGRIVSAETRKRMSLANGKCVVKYDLLGNKLEEYRCAKVASDVFNKTNGSKIIACCRLHRKAAYGFQWRYKSDNIENCGMYSVVSIKGRKLDIEHRNKAIRNLKNFKEDWIK